MLAGMYIVVMVNIVMVELNVVGVALGPIFESELLTVLDVVFKSAVVHNEPF